LNLKNEANKYVENIGKKKHKSGKEKTKKDVIPSNLKLAS